MLVFLNYAIFLKNCAGLKNHGKEAQKYMFFNQKPFTLVSYNI